MSPEVHSIGFWLKWMLTFLGFPLGGGLAYVLVRSIEGVAEAALGGAAAGIVIGAGQWLVLRQTITLSGWWIPATGVGLATGLAASVALVGTGTAVRDLAARGALTGVLLGTMQWFVLRQTTAMAGWWVAVVAVGWVVGWMVTRGAGVDVSKGWTVFGASGALVFTALTGLALAWFLRHPLLRP
jgi:hypothetical protein